jgi:hypothetical protein
MFSLHFDVRGIRFHLAECLLNSPVTLHLIILARTTQDIFFLFDGHDKKIRL